METPTFNLPVPSKTGHTFAGWYANAGLIGSPVTQIAQGSTENKAFWAQWQANTNTPYRVEHYQEKTDIAGQYPESPSGTDSLTGTTGAAISVTLKTYPGFEPDKQEPSSAAIAADGSTVVKVYYKRKTVSLTFNLNGGNIGGSTANVTLTGRFGAAFTAPQNPVKTGYTFTNWSPALPSPLVFPDSDSSYTAQWVANTYTVTFSVDGGNGSLQAQRADNNQTLTSTGSTPVLINNVPHGSNITFTAVPALAWEVEQWTQDGSILNGTSSSYQLTVTAAATVKVKFKKKTTVKSADPDPWKLLKEVVSLADDNALINIEGEITATNADGNNGEIIIDKNLTIQGKTGSTTGILNANKDTYGKPKHRIFKVEAGKTLTIQNLMLQGGIAEGEDKHGGSILVKNGSVTMTGCTIKDCKAEKDGGGVYADKDATVTMTDCTLSGNRAIENRYSRGGAVYAQGARINITNCTLKGNHARSDGGAIYADASDGTASAVTISGGTIGGTGTNDGNKVTNEGAFGGGIYVNDDCTLMLDEYIDAGGTAHGVQIIGNTAGRAGGVRANSATVTMTGCTISGNKAEGSTGSGGGGVYICGGTFDMTRCTLTGNTATRDGGGIYVKNLHGTPSTVTISGGSLTGNKTVRYNGGGIYIDNGCTVTLQNDTDGNGAKLVGNEAGTADVGQGGGVCAVGGDARLNMKGSAQIAVNNGVYLVNQGNSPIAMITIDGQLTPQDGIAARIALPNGKYQTSTQVLDGSAVGTEYTKFTVTPQQGTPTTYWGIDSSGKLSQNCTDIAHAIPQSAIQAAENSMSSYEIPNLQNLQGKLMFYKTSTGNFGVMFVTEVNNTSEWGSGHIMFNYRTFNPDGSIKKQGNNKKVVGTNTFDLDNEEYNNVHADFLVKNVNSNDRRFTPQNGAKFYVLP